MIFAIASVADYAAAAVATLGAVGITFGAYRAILAFRPNGRADPGTMIEPRLDALEARADAHDGAEARQWDKLEAVGEDVSYIRGRIDGLPCLREGGCPHGKG